MYFKSHRWNTKDKISLFVRCWIPENKAQYTIIIVHGLGEHSGRYENWASRFVQKGFNIIAFDLRGHGQSTGKKGHAKSINVLLNDIDLILHKTKKLFPNNHIILYGHSMGGNLVLNSIIRRNRDIHALIVTSPWIRLKNEPSKFLLKLSSTLSRITPGLGLKNGLNPADISSDPVEVEKYKNDPLNHDRISFRLFHDIYQGGYYILRNVFKINVPILLMHGTSDNITSYHASKEFVRNTNMQTRLKLWENQRHELHHDQKNDEVFDYLISWFQEIGICEVSQHRSSTSS